MTLDCGLTGAIENPFDLSTLETDDDSDQASPENWLALSCSAHNLSNCLDKFLHKFVPQELKKCSSLVYEDELKKIKSFINSCSHRTTRKHAECPKSFNDYIFGLSPKDDHKLQIAKYKYPDFEEKSQADQKEILDSIKKYPQIKKISVVRFRDWLDSLKRVAMNKNLIEKIAIRDHFANELLIDGNLNWDLVESLIEIMSIARKHLDYHERASASVSMHLQSLLDIIAETLNSGESTNER